ncbi:unnamed protein product [Chrysoparadoxa australica]
MARQATSSSRSPPHDRHQYRELIRVGDPVKTQYGKTGVVKFIGETHFQNQEQSLWCGMELDERIGRHDGAVNGIRYFQCMPDRGLFVPMHTVMADPTDRTVPQPPPATPGHAQPPPAHVEGTPSGGKPLKRLSSGSKLATNMKAAVDVRLSKLKRGMSAQSNRGRNIGMDRKDASSFTGPRQQRSRMFSPGKGRNKAQPVGPGASRAVPIRATADVLQPHGSDRDLSSSSSKPLKTRIEKTLLEHDSRAWDGPETPSANAGLPRTASTPGRPSAAQQRARPYQRSGSGTRGGSTLGARLGSAAAPAASQQPQHRSSRKALKEEPDHNGVPSSTFSVVVPAQSVPAPATATAPTRQEQELELFSSAAFMELLGNLIDARVTKVMPAKATVTDAAAVDASTLAAATALPRNMELERRVEACEFKLENTARSLESIASKIDNITANLAASGMGAGDAQQALKVVYDLATTASKALQQERASQDMAISELRALLAG